MPLPSDSYDDCFSDMDEGSLDRIKSLSPEKREFPLQTGLSLTPSKCYAKRSSRRRGHTVGSYNQEEVITPSHRKVPYPSTPPRKRDTTAMTTRPGRFSIVHGDFFDPAPMSPPTPKRLFPAVSTSKSTNKDKLSYEYWIVDSDDSDIDRDEVFSDTDSPTSGRSMVKPSHASVSSLDSASSGWSIPSSSSLLIKKPPEKTSAELVLKPPMISSPNRHHKVDKHTLTATIELALRPPLVDEVFVSSFTSSPSTNISSDNGKRISPPAYPALEAFLSGPIGVDLLSSIIAHDTRTQKLLDEAQVAWGVQYELARGVSKGLWQWSDVEPKIHLLKGLNAQVAYKVRSIMEDRPLKGFADLSVWEELDREQAAILENQERGLGLMGDWMGCPNWYGGQVQQPARLVKFKPTYKIHLEPLEKRRSHRLARYLGSRRVIQLRIPNDLVMKENKEVKEFLLQKFILCGRVFVPLFSKENGVYMVETNQDYGRRPVAGFGDQYRQSFAEIIRWHNDLGLNKDQPISKWSARFALIVSNSVPVLLFKEENILFIDDIYASQWDGMGKAPAEQIVTDGCGFINRSGLRAITDALGMNACMTAVQGRIHGGKGLWITHPTDNDLEPKIWIRKSQSKVVYSYPLDRAHRIFDLLSISRPSPPANLSKQSIMNLWHNGVSDEVLAEMMVKGLKEQVEPLMKWEGPHSMVNLWSVINQFGSVARMRLVRITAGLSRALGLQKREWGSEDIPVEEHVGEAAAKGVTDDELAELAHTGRNEYSGAPVATYEAALELVQAGFRPDQLKELREKLRGILKNTITSIVENFQIPLPQSLSNFIIPDPVGILEEGEVYYRSSQPLIDPEQRTYFNILTGPVLIGRYPVRLPSDIQKLEAVNKPELFPYSDVLVVSTKGRYSIASILAGGDFDGDEEFIIKEPGIVEAFQNKQLTEMPSNLIRDNFEAHVESVISFANRVITMSSGEAQKALQEVLLMNLNDSKVGIYSKFHDYSVWKYGYDDPETIRLAYMFNAVLDSGKTGLRLKANVFEQDQRLFGGEIPLTSDSFPTIGNKPFIFHSLHRAGTMIGEELLRQYNIIAGEDDKRDQDLMRPYNTASERALGLFDLRNDSILTDELRCIREAVGKAYELWMEGVREARVVAERESASPKKKRKHWPRTRPDPTIRAAQAYAEDLPPGYVVLFQNVNEIKASYAYHKCAAFALQVAFRDICEIKARASRSGIAPIVRSFDEAKTIPATYMKALTKICGPVNSMT